MIGRTLMGRGVEISLWAKRGGGGGGVFPWALGR